jgi:hypothetical protein
MALIPLSALQACKPHAKHEKRAISDVQFGLLGWTSREARLGFHSACRTGPVHEQMKLVSLWLSRVRPQSRYHIQFLFDWSFFCCFLRMHCNLIGVYFSWIGALMCCPDATRAHDNRDPATLFEAAVNASQLACRVAVLPSHHVRILQEVQRTANYPQLLTDITKLTQE